MCIRDRVNIDGMLVTLPVHVVRHFGTNCCLLRYCSIIKFSFTEIFYTRVFISHILTFEKYLCFCSVGPIDIGSVFRRIERDAQLQVLFTYHDQPSLSVEMTR